MPNRKLFVVALATLLTLGAASPALADCCDSVLDCAATVVTEGVSCAVQEFIDTVKGLVKFIDNLLNEATGATADASNAAKKAVDETIETMSTQAQNSDATLRQAEADGKRLAQEETQFPKLTATTVATAGPTTSATTGTSGGTTRPPGARQAAHAPPPPPPPASTSGNSNQRTMVKTTSTATAVTPSGATGSTKETKATTVAPSTNEEKLAAPARAFMSEMTRASAEITKERTAGAQDLTTVNQYMATARQTEGAGFQSAQAIADKAISAPFKNLLSRLSSMLTNPTDLTDPSSAIEAAGNSLMSSLDVSISQVVDAITAGPDQAFQSAQPSYTDIQNRADHAQQIASAMDVLYRYRTPAARAALVALLPEVAVTATSATKRMSSVASTRVEFTTVMSRFTASRQKVKSDYLARFQGFSSRMAQYKAVRVKAHATRSSIATYKSNFSSKLDASISGKTAAEIATQRDQLIAQARTRFASDPKTRDAVIALLNSEMSKRASVAKR